MKRRLLVTFLCLCLIMQSAMIPVKTVVAEETGTQGETDSLEWIKTALPEGTYEYSDTSGTKTLKIIGEAQEVQLLAPLSIPDTLTLDLNGHTLKAAEKNNAVEMNFEDNNEENAENFKTLTIISTSGQGTIIGASYQGWNSVYCNKCNIIVSQNVTLKGGQTGYGLYSSKGNVTVKSGARIEGGGYGTSNAGLGLYKNDGDITIESGSSVIGGSGNGEKNGGTGIFITKGNKITVDGLVTGGNGKAGGVGIYVNGSVDNPIDIIINKSGKVTGGNGISDNGEGGKGVYFPYGGNITVSGTVSGGTGNLQKSDSGVGIYCDYISDISVESNIIIKSGGTVTGGDGNKESENGSDGIYITGGSVMVEEGAEVKGGGATNLYGTGGNALTANRTTASQVTATIAGTVIGGDGTKKGGYGAYGQNKNCTITISGKAMGGKAGDEYEGGTGGTGVCFHTVTVEDGGSVIGGDSDSNRGTGGCGVYTGDSVIVEKEGRVIGGNANKTNGTGGDGIYSTSGSVEVSGTAIGGEASGSQGKGGVGVYSESGKITVSGKATGGSATGTDGTGGHGAYCKYPESKITGTSEGGRGHSKNGLDVCYIYPVTVGGVKVTSENQNNITGESFEGSASYDPDSNILSLKDGTNPNSINVKLDRVILELNGTNNI